MCEGELEGMKIAALKELCRERDLKVSGRKQELVQRLLGHEASLVATNDVENDAAATDEEVEALAEEALGDAADFDEAALGRSSKRQPTAVDNFIEALENDEVDHMSLEEIFNIQRPQPGEIVKGQVSSVVEFGAFVELEGSGWTGLVHISEISNVFVENIEDYLRPGQNVEAVVIKGGSDRLDRLALSMRRLTDPTAAEAEQANPNSLASIVSHAGAAGMQQGRRDPVSEAVRRLEVRIGAIEGVMLQLGHGHALRSAQEESRVGTTMPVVPHVETMLSGIPALSEELQAQRRRQKEADKRDTNRILDGLLDGFGLKADPPLPAAGASASDGAASDVASAVMWEGETGFTKLETSGLDLHEESVREDESSYGQSLL